MDKPAASIIQTPKDTKSKKYVLKDQDNNKYDLLITVKDDMLFFDLKDIRGLSTTYSKNNLSLEELQKICWIFFRYNDIYTLFDKTFANMKENQIELLKKDNDVSIIRKFYQDDEIIKAQFDLEEKTSSSGEKFDNLLIKVFEQEKIINELKQTINSQDYTIKELKKNIEDQKILIFILFKMNYLKKNIKLISERSFTCDYCKKDYVRNAYCCESLDFDLCENCFGKIPK